METLISFYWVFILGFIRKKYLPEEKEKTIMRRPIFLILFFICLATSGQAQDTTIFKYFYINPHAKEGTELESDPFSPVNIFEDMLITKYPCKVYKGMPPTNNNPFLSKYWGKVPAYLYENINTLKKVFPKRTEAFFLRRFIPNNGDYYLINAHFMGYGSDGQKYLLITFDTTGQIIDYLETSVKFPDIYLKQWKLTSDMQVSVYQIDLEPIDNKIEDSYTLDRNGQRIDTFYQIDSTGKFKKIKEIRYQPQIYSSSYLNNIQNNIWEGNEKSIPNLQ